MTGRATRPGRDPMAARFSAGEMARRLRLARAFLADHGLDAVVVYGAGSNNANLCWLSNHRDLHGAYLVVPAEGQPRLLVSFLNHLPNARERSAVPAEWGGHRPAGQVAHLLREHGARRVGLVGGRASYGFGMPYLHYLALREAVPEVDLVDVTADFDALLLVKSDEEIDRLRAAAELTDLALAALAERTRPGMTEYELVAMAEYGYRRLGGEVGITFLRSMPMAAPTGIVPAQRPSGRRIERGDVVICELSATSDGYSGQVLWPVFVAADPTPEWQRLYDAAYQAFDGLRHAVRHGATVADAVAAAQAIPRAGYTICDSLLHGFGLGLHPPYVDPDVFEHPPADGGDRFERGMAVVLQPNPITRDERMGIQLGALTVVRDDGAHSLHAVPAEPLVATG